MKERLLLITLFYKSFSSFSLLVSIGFWTIANLPTGEAFWRFLPLYVLLKIPTNCLIWYYLRSYNPNRLFFYSNKGISEIRLFVSAFLLDMALFFALVILVIFCRRIAYESIIRSR
jgi:hypothetical protein